MDHTPKYNFPWELISGSFSGTLAENDNLQLQEWLDSDQTNREKYSQLLELWKNGMEDYKIYQMANENKAWDALRPKLDKTNRIRIHQGNTNKIKYLKTLITVAAVFLGLIGLWVILTKNNPVIYETASGIQKKITLIDGSTVTLSPNTRIEISPGYNKINRTIFMTTGHAYFEVVHQTKLPFLVELETTQVLDLGTSFTINKGKNEIKVSVATGKVNFIKRTTREHRELIAGTNVTYNVQQDRFSEILSEESSLLVKRQKLIFKDTPLSEVIILVQKVYNKKIKLSNGQIADKKITAQLDGMSYDTVMQVICKSLGLEFSLADSVYILNNKKTEQP